MHPAWRSSLRWRSAPDAQVRLILHSPSSNFVCEVPEPDECNRPEQSHDHGDDDERMTRPRNVERAIAEMIRAEPHFLLTEERSDIPELVAEDGDHN